MDTFLRTAECSASDGIPPNPRHLYGIRLYSDKEIREAKGLKKEELKFRNAKAMELSGIKGIHQKLQNKAAVEGAIVTSWILHKSSLLDLYVDEAKSRIKKLFDDDFKMMATCNRNRTRMNDCNLRINHLYEQLRSGSNATLQVEVTSEMSELRKAQEALRKALFRLNSRLDLYEKKLSAESVSITMRCGLSPLSSSLDSSEIGDIVETIKLEHTTDIVTDDNGPLNNLTLLKDQYSSDESD